MINVSDPQVPGDEFWDARPNLARIRDFARARWAAPWAVLGCVLARAVADTDHQIVIQGKSGGFASLNLFVALVGRSGAGKTEAAEAAACLIETVSTETVGIGSGEGIAHIFAAYERGQGVTRTSYNAIIEIDEIDTLRGIVGRQGSTLLPELRKAWVGGPLGFQYADKAKRLKVPKHEYRLAIVCGVQPGHAGVLLDDITAGTPQRFLWLPSVDEAMPDDPEEVDPSPLVLATPAWGAKWSEKRQMRVCQRAQEECNAGRRAQVRGLAGDDLDSHALLLRLKVAAALAIVTSDDPTTISDSDWDLAGEVMQVSDVTRESVIEEARRHRAQANAAQGRCEADRAVLVNDKVRQHEIERVAGLIIRKIEKAGALNRKQLRDAVSRDRRYLTEALDWLTDAGKLDLGADGRYAMG